MFVRPLFTEPLKLDPATTTEWEYHLMQAVTEIKGTGEWRAQQRVSASEADKDAFAFQVSTCMSRLLLLRITPGRLLFQPFAVADSDAFLEGDAPVWRYAIEEAVRRLGQDREFAWTAVVGPHESCAGTPLALEAAGAVARVTLTPGDPVQSVAGSEPWWPIVVAGKSRSYSFSAAQAQAGRDLRELTALLSLAAGQGFAFLLRRGPVEPDASGFASRREPIPVGIKRFAIPDWLDHGWRRLQDDPSLRESLLAHSEGLALWRKHPSMSIVAFVAAIEGIGARYVPLKQRCEKCDQETGAIRRFKHAVALGGGNAKRYEAIYKKGSSWK